MSKPGFSLKRFAATAAVVMMVLGFVAVGCFYAAQDSLMYFPSGYSDREFAFAQQHTRLVEYETDAGKQVAFYVPPDGDSAPARVWILFGGNGALAFDWLDLVRELNLAGAGVGFLLIDYPGYGRCEGKPSLESIATSVTTALNAFSSQIGISRDELGRRASVLGHSLGAAVALMTTDNEELGSTVVLLSPFTTMEEMASMLVSESAGYLVRDRYDNRAPLRALASRANVRIVIIHGQDDDLIPVEMGEELARISPERIEFHAIPGAGHNDIIGAALPVLRDAVR